MGAGVMFDDDDLRRIAGDTDDSMRSLQVRLLAEVALRLALLAESVERLSAEVAATAAKERA